MFIKTVKILECSRVFSLPTTIMSWLVIFTYSAIDSGNVLYGLLAFIGLCFTHLATNLLDDYFDYKSLIKQVDFDKNEYLKNSQKTKCRYIINGTMTEKQLLYIVGVYLLLAFIVGVYLYLKCGIGVFYFALTGALIAISYPFLSRFCLSEISVAIAYGPALFGGVYYVMTGTYSNNIFILSIPTMIMTVILLYIHTIMDYEFDLAEGKYTICNRFSSQLDSLIILKSFLILAYLSLILLPIFDILDWQIFFVCITIPMAVDLFYSLKDFSCNPESMPEKKWFHFPMEGLSKFTKRGEASFMIRMFQARNLMAYFSLLLTIVIIICLWV